MGKTIFALLFLVSPSLWARQSVGKIVDLVGTTEITRPQEKGSAATIRQEIYLGDSVKTSSGGAVKILFNDDTLLTVKENSSVLISEFLFDPKAKQRKVVFDASLGRIRTVVGKFFGKEEPVEIKTPTAVAGIRGTDIGVDIQQKSTKFYCFNCEANVVSIYNRAYANQTVKLMTDQAIEIIQALPASEKNITPVPENFQENKNTIFGIQKGAVSQSTEKTTKEIAKEVAEKTTEKTAEKAPEKSLVDTVLTTKEGESLTADVNPATTNTTTATLPGGGTESGSTSTVTIHIPSS